MWLWIRQSDGRWDRTFMTVAAASGQTLRGAALLAIYALGMSVPLFLVAAL